MQRARPFPSLLVVIVILRFCILIALLSLVGCEKTAPGFSGQGKKPVYLPLSELDDITNQAPQAIINSGPIYLIGDYFFMIEDKRGLHVFDVSDDQQEEALTFIQVPAITDFTIDGNYLYADSWMDIVTIEISDIYNIQFISRQLNVIDPILYPALYNGWFECVDLSRGAIVGWEETELVAALCETVN